MKLQDCIGRKIQRTKPHAKYGNLSNNRFDQSKNDVVLTITGIQDEDGKYPVKNETNGYSIVGINEEWDDNNWELIEEELTNLDKSLKHHHVWYIISQDKIVLERDQWSRELLLDDGYFYVGSYVSQSMRDCSYAKNITGLDE